MLTVVRTITIERPHSVVQSQFADVAYHERTAPHRGVRFRVIDDSTTGCEYEQVTRQGPVRLRQCFRLDHSDAAHQAHTVVAGPFLGGSLTFDIRPSGPTSTVVTATLAAPATVLTRLAGPVLRQALGRSLDRALAEDKADIESGDYERHAGPAR